MFIDFLINKFEKNKTKNAIVLEKESFDYSKLLEKYKQWKIIIDSENIESGSIVSIESDYNPDVIALFLALLNHKCIIAPITIDNKQKINEYLIVASVEYSFIFEKSKYNVIQHKVDTVSPLLKQLRNESKPGLILFSSGTTGISKAAVHDFSRLLVKYKTTRKDFVTMAFMFYDHIGGVDTLFYALSNSSTIVIVKERSPENVCKMIEKHKVEVLPTTPTFLNLLLISDAYQKYDLSSIKYITYGTEVMPELTLKKCRQVFPNAKIIQKYGTTEVGTLHSKSLSSDSLWVKIGGEGFKTRIVDGMLQIRAESAMLGYLNAPQPFTEDGWFITGDSVLEKDGYYKILGRKSELINVGGEKVYPAEVENVILEVPNVSDVTVYGAKNPLMGNIVCANITTIEPVEDKKAFVKEVKKYCQSKLENYKAPVKIKIVSTKQHGDRFKKLREAK